MILKMTSLEKCFKAAKDSEAQWIGVCIKTEGHPEEEIIINPKENFDVKLEYYKKAYTDDLVLKTYDGIKIVGFTYADDFTEIQSDLCKQEISS